MSILSDAINAERASRAGETTPATIKPATAANEIDPERVAALAAELVAKQVHAADTRTCKVCGSPESAWRTSPETSSTEGEDDENGDLEGRKAAAVKAAVLAERAKHLTPAEILRNSIQEQKRDAKS